jgi:hypothetical protein
MIGLRRAALLLCMISVSAGAQGGFNSKRDTYDVPVMHPPELLLPTVTRVAIRRFGGRGNCGREIEARLADAITRNGRLHLVAGVNLSGITERDLQSSSYSNQQISAVLGTAAIVTGSVLRCGADTSAVKITDAGKDKSGRQHRTLTRETIAHLSMQVQIIDVTTSQVTSARQIAFDRPDVRTTTDTLPQPANGAELLAGEIADATEQILRIVLPWQETLHVVVHADKECDLMPAAALIRAGNFAAAADTMQRAIDRSCDAPDDKIALAKAYQDKGVALLLAGRADEAIAPLQQSNTLWRGDISQNAIAAAQMVISVREEQKRQDAIVARQRQTSASAAQKANAAILSNSDVVDMVAAKFSDQLVISKIKASGCKFDTSPAALIQLKKNGVSDAVLIALNEKTC